MLYSLVVGCVPLFWWNLVTHSSGLRKKTFTGFSEMLVILCLTAWCLIPEDYMILTLCRLVVNLIKYLLVPGQFKFLECSTPKCTVTYILTL
jgi:hypothetical protein